MLPSLKSENIVRTKGKLKHLLAIVVGVVAPLLGNAQNSPAKDTVPLFTLEQCISYAMQNQPGINQAVISQAIAKTTNEIALSGWLPQVSIAGNLTHYAQLPTGFTTNAADPSGPPVPVKTGIANTATPGLYASETIFEPELLYAANSASLYTKQAQEATDSTRIGIVVNVSKSFYSLLLTLEQINVLKEDTARLGRTVTDTYHQYVGGIVDETDYQEAIISLNNSKILLKQESENVSPQYELLKMVMGYPPGKQFNVAYDTSKMVADMKFDTTQALKFENRIEYQQLQTGMQLQHQLTTYYSIASLPTLSAFYDYINEFENSNFSDLFNASYPYSYMGLSLNIPLFTGMSHFENRRKSELQEQLLGWSETNLKSSIYSQYVTTLGNYKSNLYTWKLSKENASRAEKTYYVVELQYKQGIVPYLNLIIAETNLIQAEISYLNSLFQTLQSKIDLEKSIGIVPYTSYQIPTSK